MNYNTKSPKYKAQALTNNLQTPMVGCIYSGDAGNSDWHTGMLIQINGDEATIVDARKKNRVVILSTLRSIQAPN